MAYGSISAVMEIARSVGAVDVAEGSPVGPFPAGIRAAMLEAVEREAYSYTSPLGLPALRDALLGWAQRSYSCSMDLLNHSCITCGATEGVTASLLSLVVPGDEVILFEPFYDGHLRAIQAVGGRAIFVKLAQPAWSFSESDLFRAVSRRTRAVIVTTPHNPTGKVFTAEELLAIARALEGSSAICISDEVYRELYYTSAIPTSPLEVPGLAMRTLCVGSVSKTYGLTGWRVGWILGSEELLAGAAEAHLALTAAAPTPLQLAAVTALEMNDDYYHGLRQEYRARRDLTLQLLRDLGFTCTEPDGAFYVMASVPSVLRGTPFLDWFLHQAGVAVMPANLFYAQSDGGGETVRFAFCKPLGTLEEAGRRLAKALRRTPTH